MSLPFLFTFVQINQLSMVVVLQRPTGQYIYHGIWMTRPFGRWHDPEKQNTSVPLRFYLFTCNVFSNSVKPKTETEVWEKKKKIIIIIIIIGKKAKKKLCEVGGGETGEEKKAEKRTKNSDTKRLMVLCCLASAAVAGRAVGRLGRPTAQENNRKKRKSEDQLTERTEFLCCCVSDTTSSTKERARIEWQRWSGTQKRLQSVNRDRWEGGERWKRETDNKDTKVCVCVCVSERESDGDGKSTRSALHSRNRSARSDRSG